jgi:hypothetical protein
MICLAAYLNYIYKKPGENNIAVNGKNKTNSSQNLKNKNKHDSAKEVSSQNTKMNSKAMFAESKMKKARTESENLKYIKRIIDDTTLSQKDREKARLDYERHTDYMTKEANIERILSVKKGFNDVIVQLDGSDDLSMTANVMVRVNKFDTQKQVQIEDAVTSQTKITDFDKIKINSVID